MNATEHGLTFMEQGNEGAPEWNAGDKTFCPIDRVEHPDEFSVFVFVAELFTDDTMGREFMADHAPN